MSNNSLRPELGDLRSIPRFAALALTVRCARRVQPLFDRTNDSPEDWPTPSDFDYLMHRAETGASTADGYEASFAAAKAEHMSNGPGGLGGEEIHRLMMCVGWEAGAYYLSPPPGPGENDKRAEQKHIEYPGGWLSAAADNSVFAFDALWGHAKRDRSFLVENIRRDFDSVRELVRCGRITSQTAVATESLGPLWLPAPPDGWPTITLDDVRGFLKSGRDGVQQWNRRRFRNKVVLDGIDLSESDLRFASLSGLSMRGSSLRRADLSLADLTATDLRGADLSASNLDRAHLRDADLRGANLKEARLIDTSLMQANVRGAIVGGTLIMTSLTDTLGVADLVHAGASRPDIWTIRSLNQEDADSFVTGCQLDEQDASHFRAVVAKPIQFYTCFISFAVDDQSFADDLYDGLLTRRIRCWKFDRDARGGKYMWGEIDQAIRWHEKTLVVLSSSSLRSPPVIREIERALKQEELRKREGSLGVDETLLFLLRLDDAVFSWEHRLAVDVRERVIVDARSWINDLMSFSNGVDRLTIDLQKT